MSSDEKEYDIEDALWNSLDAEDDSHSDDSTDLELKDYQVDESDD